MPLSETPQGYTLNGRFNLYRTLCLVGLVLFAGVALACDPIRARQFPASCQDGEVRTCLGRCVPAANQTNQCTPGRDECAAGYTPCPAGLACQRGENGQPNACVQIPSLFCDPDAPPGSATNLCDDGSFCRRYTTATQVGCEARPRLNIPEDQMRGICSRGRQEGETCDGDWARAHQPLAPGATPICSACAPGLVCWNGRCRRPCRPEEGGLGNCVPDESSALFTSQWSCTEQRGALTPARTFSTVPLCSFCVPHLSRCELPPLLGQLARNPSNPCCDPNDICSRLFDTSGAFVSSSCCRPGTFGTRDGAPCEIELECCPVSGPNGLVRRCCDSPGLGCREPSSGPSLAQQKRCGGCGPGTGIPCCDRSRGCSDGQTCVGEGDLAQCIPCGTDRGPCCRRDNARTCREGLTCFNRSGVNLTGDRCERCGGSGEQCCPDGGCGDGNTCVNGVCTPCGEPGAPCCNGRCNGEGRECRQGRCVQVCGVSGLPCCGARPILGPRRGYCVINSVNCNQDTFACEPCGANGQLSCFTGTPCNPGLGRDPRTGRCTECGTGNQPCCPTGVPCRAGFVCGQGGLCVPCGQYQQPCCPGRQCGRDAFGTECNAINVCDRPPG